MWPLWAACVCASAAAALLPLDAAPLRASVGGYAVFNCHLDFPFGNEIPYHLHWDKDGESIYSWYSGAGGGEESGARVADRWGGRVRRLDDGRLGLGRASINVSAVRETDAGLYRCLVTFPNRSPPARDNGTYYRLEVEGGNLIATPPTNVTVVEGERAELECAAKSGDARVQWLRDGAPLDAAPERAARSERPANGSLVLRHADSADAGEYECRVQDPAGAAQSASAYLDVHYKAKVVYSPKERYLPLGKPASLDCHFSANPPLTNLRWEKDGFLFDPYNVPGVFYSRNGSLLFNEVDESHEGQYSCTPYNALGTAGASARVRVSVQRPPRLALRPLPLYVARLGGAVTLPCALAAGERAALAWARQDGAALPAARLQRRGGNLTIAPVAADDAGVYECRAANEAAAVAAAAELRVENVTPRAPRRLAAAPAPRAVRLSWQAGAGAPDADYTVWYRERDAAEWRTMRILSRGVTEATLSGLRPAAAYELRVLAQDRLGDGLFSQPLFVRTPPDDAAEAADATDAPEAAEVAASTAAPEDAAAETEAGGEELAVSVRLVDAGALVRWAGGEGRCSLRWYEGERLLAVTHTERDYALVPEVAEGAQYRARVSCARGGGGAALAVPAWARLRAAAAGAAVAALLLAALGAALLLVRRRRRAPPLKRR